MIPYAHMPMEGIAFTVRGLPAPQGSKRHVGGGRMVESSKKVQPWRQDVRAAAEEAMNGHLPFDGPLEPTPLQVGDEVRVTRPTLVPYELGFVFKVTRIIPYSYPEKKQQYYVMGGKNQWGGDNGIWPKFLERTNGHPISYKYEQEED